MKLKNPDTKYYLWHWCSCGRTWTHSQWKQAKRHIQTHHKGDWTQFHTVADDEIEVYPTNEKS